VCLSDRSEAAGIVNERYGGRVVIERGEVIARDFQALQHTLTDGHARHHDDEFLEALALVQLEDRAEIDIGFPGPGLHFDRKFPALQGRDPLDVVRLLDLVDIGEKLLVRQHQVVANAPRCQQHASRHGATNLETGLAKRLPVEHVGDGVDRIELVGLGGIEFKIHHGPCPHTVRNSIAVSWLSRSLRDRLSTPTYLLMLPILHHLEQIYPFPKCTYKKFISFSLHI